MLSYYLQLRERMRSSIRCSANPEQEAHPQPEVLNAVGREDTPHVDLGNAFEAMIEEIKFDWPDFSPIDRVKCGLLQSSIGLVLFLGLIVLIESRLR